MSHPSETSDLNPQEWVKKYGDLFYRYALSRLNDQQIAEDVVQETFLAAIKSAANFRGDSRESTWLSSILRRKTIDVFRNRERQRRNFPVSPDAEVNEYSEGECTQVIGASFAFSPSRALADADFLKSVKNCLATIPKSLADVFVLREIEQLEPEEICELLNITKKNLWVRMHRARIALAECTYL